MVVHLRFLTLVIGMYVVRDYSSHLAGGRRPAAVIDGTSEQARLGNLLVSTFVDPRRGRYGNILANGQYSYRVAKLCAGKTVGSWNASAFCHREVVISLWEVWGRERLGPRSVPAVVMLSLEA